MSTSTKHQIKIAKDTLKMTDAGATIMGGMTKDEARKVLKQNGYSDQAIRSMEERIFITLTKEFKIRDIVLEKGDKVEVLKEGISDVSNLIMGLEILSAYDTYTFIPKNGSSELYVESSLIGSDVNNSDVKQLYRANWEYNTNMEAWEFYIGDR